MAFPWSVLDCPAYARLSHPARSLLMEIARQFVKDNNGRLLASGAYLLKRGWKSADVITRAKRELIAGGFIFETVMGHRPNKASWYAVTWQRLDRLKGYDEGALETFMRGAYTAGVPMQHQRTREDLYQKWRGPGKENASLTPSGGVEEAPIAPSGGVEGLTVAPSRGAINPVFAPLSTPSHGNHLEMPSTAGNPLSAGSGNLTLTTPLTPTAVTEPSTATAGACDEPDGAVDNSERNAPDMLETIRVRDHDLDPEMYDPTTGEHSSPPLPPPRSQASAADNGVTNALAKRSAHTALAGAPTKRRCRG